jgi:hypothetical protein
MVLGTRTPTDNPRETPRRVHRLLGDTQRTVTEAARALSVARTPATTQRCLNPACAQQCHWTEGGRPSYFCTRACREAYWYERNELVLEIAALQDALAQPGGTYRDRRRVQAEVARRRWVLGRYVLDSRPA